MATYQKITSLLFKPQGVHDSAVDYSVMDVVASPDKSRVYFAVQNVPAGIALTNEEYWQLQIDLSSSKSAMDEALASFGSYAKEIGMRVKGETAKASGNPVTFLPDAGSLLQPVTVLDVQQAGSGDPSPSNIRPIIGYDKLDLNQIGLNLFDKNINIDEYVGLGYRKYPIYATPGATVTWLQRGVEWLNSNVYGLFCESIDYNGGNDPGTISSWIGDSSVGSIEYGQFVVPDSGVFYLAVYVGNDAYGIAKEKGVLENIILVYGNYTKDEMDAFAPYEPYCGKTHTVQFGQTVCGGRFDWLTGKLAAEWKCVTFGADTPFSAWGSDLPHLFTFLLADAPVDWDVLCSHYTKHESYDKNGAYIIPQSKLLLINDIRFNSADDFNAYLAAQSAAASPVQVAYKLAEPIEIQLTPHIITAADPEQTNTLYGDGRIDAEYVKPLHVSIEERVAAALAAAKE